MARHEICPLGAAIVMLLGATFDAHAIVVILNPSKDATLYEDANGATAAGLAASLVIGQTGPRNSSSRHRGLIEFDIAGNIPSGATITGVSLTFNVSRTAPGAPTETHTLHIVTSDWGEGSDGSGSNPGPGVAATAGAATWLHTFFNTSFWQTPGGDFSSTVSASADIGSPQAYTFSSAAMVSDVQNWLNGASNFGWIVIGAESGATDARFFDSKDNANPASRPSLTVTFMPAPEPGSVVLLGVLATGCLARRPQRILR